MLTRRKPAGYDKVTSMLTPLLSDLAGNWQQAAVALIGETVPVDAASPEAWQVCAALLPRSPPEASAPSSCL